MKWSVCLLFVKDASGYNCFDRATSRCMLLHVTVS